MRILIAFAVLVFSVFSISCTSTGGGGSNPVGCSVETVVTTAVAGAVASTDSCTNVDQIQKDIQSALGSINLCASVPVQAQMRKLAQKQAAAGKEKGVVGDIVCPLAVDAVMSLIGTKVPAAWGCTGSSGVAAAISSACAAAVPI